MDSKNTELLKTTTLVLKDVIESVAQTEGPTAENEFIEAELTRNSQADEDDDFYFMEELEKLENKTMTYMAGKFKNLRFRRNPKYKFKTGSSYSGSSGLGFKGNRGGSSSGSYSKSGYKIGMVNRSKFKYYNCNEPGQFAIECRKPKQVRQQKESYDELKQKYDALVRKHQGNTYIAEGKSWDDSHNDEEETFGNLTLMASTSDSTPSSSKVSFLSSG